VSKLEEWSNHISNLLVGGTGVAYAICIYMMSPIDEFSNVNTSWQPLIQRLHVVASPLLVYTVGLVWSTHVWRRALTKTARVRSGWFMILIFFPMVFSGPLIQVVMDPGWSRISRYVHLFVSVSWMAFYGVHLIQRIHLRSKVNLKTPRIDSRNS
jgi:hypothetical protein